MPDKITVIGHRGSGAGVTENGLRENTLGSFERAFTDGCDEIELDLAITADSEIVIFHDEYITIKQKKTKISTLILKELKSFDPDIPTLDEVMEKFPEGKFIAELKSHSPWIRIIECLISKPYWPDRDRMKIISFNPDALLQVKRSYPAVYCNLIATAIEPKISPWMTQKQIRWCLDHGIEEISGQTWLFSGRKIGSVHEAGLVAGLGMIDSERALNKALRTNVTRLYTNRSAWLRNRLKEIVRKK